MTFVLFAEDVSQNTYTDAHFGGNVLALDDRFGDEGTSDETFAILNIDFARYPGGSMTEDCFCIATPNNDTTTDRNTGEERDILPLDEMFSYAHAEGIAVSMVIPTRIFIGEEIDSNGDR